LAARPPALFKVRSSPPQSLIGLLATICEAGLVPSLFVASCSCASIVLVISSSSSFFYSLSLLSFLLFVSLGVFVADMKWISVAPCQNGAFDTFIAS